MQTFRQAPVVGVSRLRRSILRPGANRWPLLEAEVVALSPRRPWGASHTDILFVPDPTAPSPRLLGQREQKWGRDILTLLLWSLHVEQ